MENNKLREYVNRSEAIITESPQMDEANTRKKIIEPIINLLDWNLYSDEVKLEYPVQMGRNKKKVDYALISKDTPLVFIEAKGADAQIHDKDVQQLKSYMRQDDVAFGLISNGKDFRVLKMEWGTKQTAVATLASFTLEEILDKTNTLKILSKKAIESGESKKIAKNIEKTRKAVEKLRENKSKITEEIKQVIGEEIGELKPSKIDSKSAQFVDELISTLREPVKERVEEEGEKVRKISRDKLKEYEDGEVIVCPSNVDGINFLLQYRAWGFIRINREPEYLVIYVTKPESEIQYFGKVSEIISPESEQSPVEDYEDYEHYEPGKKILTLEEGSLKKLKKPISLGDKVPYSPRYSRLKKLITADTTDDVL